MSDQLSPPRYPASPRWSSTKKTRKYRSFSSGISKGGAAVDSQSLVNDSHNSIPSSLTTQECNGPNRLSTSSVHTGSHVFNISGDSQNLAPSLDSHVLDLKESQNFMTSKSDSVSLAFASPSYFVQSTHSEMATYQEPDCDEDEGNDDSVQKRHGNQCPVELNFCSDLMDFEVGQHPNKMTISNLKPLKFPGNNAMELTEEEFMPKPTNVINPEASDSESIGLRSPNGPVPQCTNYTKTCEGHPSLPTQQMQPQTLSNSSGNRIIMPHGMPASICPDTIFTASVKKTIPPITLMNSDWLLSQAGAPSLQQCNIFSPLQQQAADALILQQNLVEMQRLQQELQQSSVLQRPTVPAQPVDFAQLQGLVPRETAENFIAAQMKTPTFIQKSAIPSGSSSPATEIERPPLPQHFMGQQSPMLQEPSNWATHFNNSPVVLPSPRNSDTKGPLAIAQAAAIALSRLPPLDFAQTLKQCRELMTTATSKVEEAYASSYGSPPIAKDSIGSNTPNHSLIQLLSSTIEEISAAVSALAPGYLDMVAEERCNTTKRPMILAHPDEFKNPSSFLKIYGDPQCNSRGGPPSHPRKGKDGNWECPKCQNVNYPRRFRCNNSKCKTLRDAEGDKLVADYARQVFHIYLPQSKPKLPAPPNSRNGSNCFDDTSCRGYPSNSQSSIAYQVHCTPPMAPAQTGMPSRGSDVRWSPYSNAPSTTIPYANLLYPDGRADSILNGSNGMGLGVFHSHGSSSTTTSPLILNTSELTPSKSTHQCDYSPAVSSAASVQSSRGSCISNSVLTTGGTNRFSNFLLSSNSRWS